MFKTSGRIDQVKTFNVLHLGIFSEQLYMGHPPHVLVYMFVP